MDPAQQSNARLVADFIQHPMCDHDFDYVQRTFGRGTYIQHNQTMEDGVASVTETVSSLVKRFPEYTYDVQHMWTAILSSSTPT